MNRHEHCGMCLIQGNTCEQSAAHPVIYIQTARDAQKNSFMTNHRNTKSRFLDSCCQNDTILYKLLIHEFWKQKVDLTVPQIL